MSRKRKIILIVSILFLTGSGLGYWWLYSLLHQDITEAELGVEEGFFDFSSAIHIPLDDPATSRTGEQENKEQTTGQIDNEENADEGEGTVEESIENTNPVSSEQNSGTSNNQSTNSQNRSKSNDKAMSPEEKEQAIYDKYYPSFMDLQSLALERLDSLVELAKKEYKEKKGTDSFSKTDFAAKYISAANKLQSEVDKVFYKLLDRMEEELVKSGLPLDLVEEAESTYKRLIKEKKSELMSKAF